MFYSLIFLIFCSFPLFCMDIRRQPELFYIIETVRQHCDIKTLCQMKRVSKACCESCDIVVCIGIFPSMVDKLQANKNSLDEALLSYAKKSEEDGGAEKNFWFIWNLQKKLHEEKKNNFLWSIYGKYAKTLDRDGIISTYRGEIQNVWGENKYWNQKNCLNSMLEVKLKNSDFPTAEILLANVPDNPNLVLDVAQEGSYRMLEMLLKRGFSVDGVNDYGRKTALHLAAQRGHVKMIRLLLKYGAQKESKNFYGETSLNIACRMGYIKAARCLIWNGADVNNIAFPLTVHAISPLEQACERGSFSIVKLLLQKGASTNTKRCLFCCAKQKKDNGIFDLLAQYGVQPCFYCVFSPVDLFGFGIFSVTTALKCYFDGCVAADLIGVL